MKIEDCFYFGKIGKSKGFKGEVNIIIDKDSPILPQDLDGVYIEIGNKLIFYPLERFKITIKNNGLGKFEGINSDNDVERIKNRAIYLSKTNLPPLQKNDFFLHDLEGTKLIDSIRGEIGRITEVNTQTEQTLLFVNYEGKEIIIPFAEDFIMDINHSSKTITLNLPEGLIHLND
ncbi:MAG: 16S rRNA processing protein RimM [Flavobacteriales bacterium]|nr:16S rRNA processing protein RimM [Flavobacteriales bacterium]|tara:strand:+ start:1129 stop:1653 length:525 start_codon:yes stop_codon:yes gene_type:complete